MSLKSSGLTLLTKLKLEHVKLNSYSRMRVDLAAQASYTCVCVCVYVTLVKILQALSKSVADGFAYFGDPQTKATEQFIRNLDRFFDCLNVCNLSECKEKRKKDLWPYRDASDERLLVRWLSK